MSNNRFLWITKDSTSRELSHSTRSEEARIRHHVQTQRHGKLARQRQSRDVALRLPPTLSIIQLGPEESRSLDYFIHRTAPEWSGWQDGDFWNGLALQTSHHDLAVAHSLVAIAAWHESSTAGPSTDPGTALRLRHLAITQHDAALEILSRSRDLVHDISLISCVILASLESYRAGRYQEYRLLRSGTAILNEVLHRQEASIMNAGQSRGADTTRVVRRQVSSLISRLQERLCMMADMPAALAYATVRQHKAQRVFNLGEDPPVIPPAFCTLRQARDCLESILVWGQQQIVGGAGKNVLAEEQTRFRRRLVGSIKRWENALNSTTRLVTEQAANANTGKLLQIAALNGVILLLTCQSPKETIFDSHNHTFRRIMDLVMQISIPSGGSTSSRGRVSFGIDCGLIDIVAFVGSRCRDTKIRRSALYWLQNNSRVEGERLCDETGQILQAWIDLEESYSSAIYDSESGSISADPEFYRRRLIAGERYHDQQLIKLLFTSYPYDPASGASDEVWIRTAGAGDTMAAGHQHVPGNMPDAIFGPAHASFFDSEQGIYHHLWTKEFHFPIPKV